MGIAMVEIGKKYVVNADFPTCKGEGGHKIHLNPFYQGSTAKDKVLKHYDPKGYKISKDGGPVYLVKDEAVECVKGKKQLEWQGRPVDNFRPCGLCRRLPDWDIEIE
jgi:hypothetical protein